MKSMSKEEKKKLKAEKKQQKVQEKQERKEARSAHKETKGSKDREIKWGKLDNTAHLFPVIAGEGMTNVYRVAIIKRRNSAGFVAAGIGYGIAQIFGV